MYNSAIDRGLAYLQKVHSSSHKYQHEDYVALKWIECFLVEMKEPEEKEACDHNWKHEDYGAKCKWCGLIMFSKKIDPILAVYHRWKDKFKHKLTWEGLEGMHAYEMWSAIKTYCEQKENK